VSLARRILTLEVGDKMESIGSLSQEFNTGRGTIQSALKLLVDEGALQIEGQGKRGSFIKSLNRPILLEKAKLTAIIGAMPIAYSTHFRAHATGHKHACQRSDTPLVLAILSGSEYRMHFLKSDRCDFIITSNLTEAKYQHDESLQHLFEFGRTSKIKDPVLKI